MTLKENGHDDETLKGWSKQDREYIQVFRNDVENLKVRVIFWTFEGDMYMVACIAEVISMYQEYMDQLIEKYKENYGSSKSKPNIDFFRRN